MNTNNTDKETVHSSDVLRLLKMTWSYRGGCLKAFFFQFMLLAITLSGLGLTGVAIDYIHNRVDSTAPAARWPFGWTAPTDWTAMQTLLAVALAIIGLALFRTASEYYYRLSLTKLLQQGIVVDLRSKLYNKIQRMGFRFFDNTAGGTLINRLAGDVQRIRSFVDGVMIPMFQVIMSLALYLTYMFSIHVGLTLACLATTPLMWIEAVRFSKRVRPAYRENMRRVDDLILGLSETLRGIHVVKGFGREEPEKSAWQEKNHYILDSKLAIFKQVSRFGPLINFLSTLNLAILLGYGGYLYIQGSISLGAGLIVFAGLLQRFSNQVSMIAGIANSIQHSLASARRVFAIMDTPIDVSSPENAIVVERPKGGIRFEGVSFHYEQNNPVLKNVDLNIRAGQSVGILGGTGSGKTALLNLIPRFYDVSDGTVYVDDIDVRSWDLDALRRTIGMVFQQSFLFSNTVAENIAFGNPEASHEQIVAAARTAAIHEFIMEMPKGYDTVLGEDGADLSGGQRQRLAIARAVLTNPAVLLLDDPTAAVDAHTEKEILQAMERAMRGRTTLLVAHRISTLRRTDRIIVMDQGEIVQQGTHDELIRTKGIYRQVAMLQADEEDIALPSGAMQ